MRLVSRLDCESSCELIDTTDGNLLIQSNSVLLVPQTRLKTVGDYTVGIAVALIWNDLLPAVVNVSSISVVEKHLKTYLFNQ